MKKSDQLLELADLEATVRCGSPDIADRLRNLRHELRDEPTLPADALAALEGAREALTYFVDRCEGNHPDGYIRSYRTYGKFKNALTQLDAVLARYRKGDGEA